MSNQKIGTVEAIMMILAIVVSHTLLYLPKNILSFMKSASILNIIYSYIATVCIFTLVNVCSPARLFIFALVTLYINYLYLYLHLLNMYKEYPKLYLHLYFFIINIFNS